MNPVTPAAPGSYTELLAPIAEHLASVEQRLEAELHSHWPEVDKILQYGFLMGGKRLRPALLLLAAEATGGVDQRHVLLATVLEMIHTATLVHDDVLDDADQRRHQPTANARWGTHTSVLLGDFLFTHAFYLASTLESTFACRLIGQATNRVCEGEMQQSRCQGRWNLSEDEYLAIIDGKTGALTECACRLGALIGEADEEVVEALSRYGRLVGRAFQITDDLLDVCGHQRLAGKTLGSDLRARKATLPVIRLVGQLNADQRPQFARLWQQGDCEAINKWLAASDALSYTRRRAREYVQQAAGELECLDPSHARDILRQLLECILVRVR